MTPVTSRKMRRALTHTLALWICAVSPLLGDVTVRYESSMKSGPAAPPQVSQQMEKMQGWGKSTLRLKSGMEMSNFGVWNCIADLPNQKIALIDPEHKTLTRLKMDEFADKLALAMPKSPEMPEQVKKVMEGIKTSFDSKKTGRTSVILGVQTEETEVVLTIEIPAPGNTGKPAMAMKMKMEIWNPTSDEMLRNQAVRELTGYQLWTSYFMNPGRMLEKMLPHGMGQGLKSLTEQLSAKKGITLRTRIAMYMLLPNAPSQSASADSPAFEMTQEAVELSSASVDEAVFRIPADYQSIDSGEFLKQMLQRQREAMGVPAKN